MSGLAFLSPDQVGDLLGSIRLQVEEKGGSDGGDGDDNGAGPTQENDIADADCHDATDKDGKDGDTGPDVTYATQRLASVTSNVQACSFRCRNERVYMEDTHALCTSLDAAPSAPCAPLDAAPGASQNWRGAIFAVFDGHAGNDASAMLREAAAPFVYRELRRNRMLDGTHTEARASRVLTEAIVSLDRDVCSECSSGSTLVLAIVYPRSADARDRRVDVVNVGDSRAYVVREGEKTGTRATLVSTDHTLDDPREDAAAVIRKAPIDRARGRVGVLGINMTRCMGDAADKSVLAPPESRYLLPVPSVAKLRIRDGEALYLCSDGMYENMAALHTGDDGLSGHLWTVFGHRSKLDAAARRRDEAALLRSAVRSLAVSYDNMTAVVIRSGRIEGGDEWRATVSTRQKVDGITGTCRSLRDVDRELAYLGCAMPAQDIYRRMCDGGSIEVARPARCAEEYPRWTRVRRPPAPTSSVADACPSAVHYVVPERDEDAEMEDEDANMLDAAWGGGCEFLPVDDGTVGGRSREEAVAFARDVRSSLGSTLPHVAFSAGHRELGAYLMTVLDTDVYATNAADTMLFHYIHEMALYADK